MDCLSRAEFPRHALEELIDNHAGCAANHTLSKAGNGTARADVAGIAKLGTVFVACQLNRALTLDKADLAAAVHGHLVFGSGFEIMQADRSAEHAADRADAKTQV